MIKGKSESTDGLSSILLFFIDSLFTGVKDSVLQGFDDVLRMLKRHALSLQRKLLRNVIVALCSVASMTALLTSLCFYLADILNWQRYAIFLILGLLLLIIALIINYFNSRDSDSRDW